MTHEGDTSLFVLYMRGTYDARMGHIMASWLLISDGPSLGLPRCRQGTFERPVEETTNNLREVETKTKMSSTTTRKRSKYQSSESDSEHSAHSIPSMTTEIAAVHDEDKSVVTIASLISCISAVVTNLHAHVDLSTHPTGVHKCEQGIIHVQDTQHQCREHSPNVYENNVVHLINQQGNDIVHDISVLPKEVLKELLQPVIKLLEQVCVDTVLPNLRPVTTTKDGRKTDECDDAGVSLGDG